MQVQAQGTEELRISLRPQQGRELSRDPQSHCWPVCGILGGAGQSGLTLENTKLPVSVGSQRSWEGQCCTKGSAWEVGERNAARRGWATCLGWRGARLCSSRQDRDIEKSPNLDQPGASNNSDLNVARPPRIMLRMLQGQEARIQSHFCCTACPWVSPFPFSEFHLSSESGPSHHRPSSGR